MTAQRINRPPARHPQTGTPAARIDRGTVYWFGLPVANIRRADSRDLAVVPVNGPSWSARNRAAVLKRYGTCAVLAGRDDGAQAMLYHLGDEIGAAVRYPGGCVFQGRWFRTPDQAAAVLRSHGGAWPAPEIRIDPGRNESTLDIRVRGSLVGQGEIQATGDVLLRHAGRADAFHSVPALLRWLRNRYATRDPAVDDAVNDRDPAGDG